MALDMVRNPVSGALGPIISATPMALRLLIPTFALSFAPLPPWGAQSPLGPRQAGHRASQASWRFERCGGVLRPPFAGLWFPGWLAGRGCLGGGEWLGEDEVMAGGTFGRRAEENRREVEEGGW